MKTIIILMTLLLNANAAITTKVVHLESVDGKTEVFVTFNGRVFEVDSANQALIQKLERARDEFSDVELVVEEGEKFKSDKEIEKILSVKIKNTPKQIINTDISVDPMTNYSPSNVKSDDLARKIFSSLNVKTKRSSQCFNRAHIWAKQMFDNFNVKSMKIFLFYTKRFRREVSNKWWFHVAPMINVNGQLKVMDREFTRKPITDKRWEEIFTGKMDNPGNYRCKRISHIKDFYDAYNTENEFCNIIHTSMFYRSPNDMKRLDKTGEEQKKWLDWEIKAAAKEAFKNWRSVYRDLSVNQ